MGIERARASYFRRLRAAQQRTNRSASKTCFEKRTFKEVKNCESSSSSSSSIRRAFSRLTWKRRETKWTRLEKNAFSSNVSSYFTLYLFNSIAITAAGLLLLFASFRCDAEWERRWWWCDDIEMPACELVLKKCELSKGILIQKNKKTLNYTPLQKLYSFESIERERNLSFIQFAKKDRRKQRP